MEINKYIDHTLLKANAAYGKIETLCAETREYDFANVCANNYWVSVCAELLKEVDVKVCTVVDLPLGVVSTRAKAFETVTTTVDSTKGIDMVLNIGGMRVRHYDVIHVDIKVAMETAEGNYAKVILKNCLLIKEEIVKACELCVEAGTAFARTSTGFSTSGATSKNVKLMEDTVKGRCLAKVAGGVRYYEGMEKVMETGAGRIDTGAGAELIQKETSGGGYQQRGTAVFYYLKNTESFGGCSSKLLPIGGCGYSSRNHLVIDII